MSAPYFLATKLEAFDGRGESDCQASHDLEDFIPGDAASQARVALVRKRLRRLARRA